MIVVLDAVRQRIYEGVRDDSVLAWIHQLVREEAIANSIEIIESMTADFAINGRMFNDDHDGHWNEYGHNFVCRQILKALLGKRTDCVSRVAGAHAS